MKKIQRHLLVPGGAGFIGTNFVDYWLSTYQEDHMIILDSLTYAGNLDGLNKIKSNNNFKFIKGTICDNDLGNQLLSQNHIDTLVHFAAESHVDRSIVSPEAFIQTNVVGTWTLLESFRLYWNYKKQPKNYRFHHISTDEVYGSLDPEDSPFTAKIHTLLTVLIQHLRLATIT